MGTLLGTLQKLTKNRPCLIGPVIATPDHTSGAEIALHNSADHRAPRVHPPPPLASELVASSDRPADAY